MDYYILNYSLILLALLITTIAQIGVSNSYKKYKKIPNKNKQTGYDVARKILDENGLENILILETKGNLTDHYDPTKKVIKLSTDIYHGTSIASTSVASHECGHAIQDKDGYTPMKIRSNLVPFVNICTRIGYFAIAIGVFFSYTIVEVGIILLATMLLFQLVTLPVEFNASNRALKQLEKLNILEKDENNNAKKMLKAAAFTYVASLLSTLIEILRYALIFTDRDR